MEKFLRSQDFKTTFKTNLTCIFYLSELIQKTLFAMTDPVVLRKAPGKTKPNAKLVLAQKMKNLVLLKLVVKLLQGQSRQTGFFELAVRDRNVQVKFLEGAFKILRFEKF